LHGGFAMMRFPADLERRYLDDRFGHRKHETLVGGLIALVLFDLLIVAEFFAIPDVLNLAIWLKLGVVSPLSLIVLLTLDKLPGSRFLDPALCLILALATGTLIVLLRKTHAPHAAFFHSALAVVLVMANSLLRLRFWYALAASLAICTGYTLGLGITGSAAPQALAASDAILLLCGAGTLISNRARERGERHDYLRALCRHLRAAATSDARTTDALNGIHDRRSFDLHLEQRWFDCRSHELPMSLLLIEADVGTEASQVQQIAAIVKSSVRHAGDLAAHLGGARFAVTLPALAENKAAEAAEQIRAAVERIQIPLRNGRSGDVVTVSVGTAVSASGHPGSPHSLIETAEEALRRAKAAGGNRTEGAATVAAGEHRVAG